MPPNKAYQKLTLDFENKWVVTGGEEGKALEEQAKGVSW